MPKENKTRHVILGLLAHEPMSGYDLKKRIESTISYFWDIGFGQIYPELKKMHRLGWVSLEIEDTGEGPNRKVYTITSLGLEEFKAWMTESVEIEKFRSEMLVKLFFGSHLGEAKAEELIGAFKTRAEHILGLFKTYKESLSPLVDEGDDHFYMQLTVLFGTYFQKAFCDWSQEALKLLTERAKK